MIRKPVTHIIIKLVLLIYRLEKKKKKRVYASNYDKDLKYTTCFICLYLTDKILSNYFPQSREVIAVVSGRRNPEIPHVKQVSYAEELLQYTESMINAFSEKRFREKLAKCNLYNNCI